MNDQPWYIWAMLIGCGWVSSSLLGLIFWVIHLMAMDEGER
jgi:hypothetical protein